MLSLILYYACIGYAAKGNFDAHFKLWKQINFYENPIWGSFMINYLRSILSSFWVH